ENGDPEFFTVEQCQSIMKLTKAEPRLTAYFAICLFAGVRPEECQRLTWKNVKMNTKEIEIPSTIAKTKKARGFVMSDNLYQWLSVADKKQQLIPSNFRKLRQKAVNGLTFEWIQDGMRKSFATYHYAKHKNLDKGFEGLRHIMGNSPSVIEKFYKGVI